jgi:hypothetical protein
VGFGFNFSTDILKNLSSGKTKGGAKVREYMCLESDEIPADFF